MRRNLLAAGLVVLAVLGPALPANAHLGRRICDIEHGDGDDSNIWTFTGGLTGGTWRNDIAGRDCSGHDGVPATATVTGTYAGHPCTTAILTGGATGVVVGGVAGYTHAGPASGFLSIDTVVVFTGACNLFASPNTLLGFAEQVHIVND